jgi:thioredoxin-related protein
MAGMVFGMLWLVTDCLADAPVGWQFEAFDSAQAASIRDGRPIFVYFGRYGCPTCARVNHESLTDPEVKQRFHANYELAYVDTESGERLRLPGGERITESALGIRYSVYGTPFFLFMEPDGTVITRIPGFVSAQQFLGLDLFVNGGHYRRQTLQEFVAGES